jgi:hypothetical protein
LVAGLKAGEEGRLVMQTGLQWQDHLEAAQVPTSEGGRFEQIQHALSYQIAVELAGW